MICFWKKTFESTKKKKKELAETRNIGGTYQVLMRFQNPGLWVNIPQYVPQKLWSPSVFFMAGQPTHPSVTCSGWIRPYQGKPIVNKPFFFKQPQLVNPNHSHWSSLKSLLRFNRGRKTSKCIQCNYSIRETVGQRSTRFGYWLVFYDVLSFTV